MNRKTEWAEFGLASHRLVRRTIADAKPKLWQITACAVLLVAFLCQTYWLWDSLLPQVAFQLATIIHHLNLIDVVGTGWTSVESGSVTVTAIATGAKLSRAFRMLIGKI